MVLVFDIPHKGTNITVSEVLKEHHDAITDIAAELGQAPVCVCVSAAAGPKCAMAGGYGGLQLTLGSVTAWDHPDTWYGALHAQPGPGRLQAALCGGLSLGPGWPDPGKDKVPRQRPETV